MVEEVAKPLVWRTHLCEFAGRSCERPVSTCGETLFKQLHPLKFIEHEHVLLIELRAHDDPAVHRGVVAKGW